MQCHKVEGFRHCERSEAIHLRARGKTKMDCFTSFAMTRVLANTRHFVRNDQGSSKYEAQRQAMDRRSFLDNEVLA